MEDSPLAQLLAEPWGQYGTSNELIHDASETLSILDLQIEGGVSGGGYQIDAAMCSAPY